MHSSLLHIKSVSYFTLVTEISVTLVMIMKKKSQSFVTTAHSVFTDINLLNLVFMSLDCIFLDHDTV
jgi:hypothetical protein